MRITIEADDGSITVHEAVREFALCGLRMVSPMNPSHFHAWSGTPGYLRGQLIVLSEEVRKKEDHGEHPA
jgi:hypothetical protein